MSKNWKKSGIPAFAGMTMVGLALGGCTTPVASQAQGTSQQTAWAAQCADDSGWDDPGPPFQVYGNTYYVGTCGIAALLVTGDQGHILIDTGTEKGADVVLANIRALGFDPADVKVLLMTHEHGDHVGGMAKMQQATGARLLVSPAAAETMRSGHVSREDPQLAIDQGMAPARVDGAVHDGMPVTLGTLSLTPMESPGHTPGATSWQWRSCASQSGGTACRTIVYADSLSPVSAGDYRFTDHAPYLANFRRSLSRLAQMECDLVITPHPSASGMRDRLLKGGLADPAGCREYAASRTKMLDERLAKEAGGN
jgi:metallo-beta-lactamase class B